MQVKITDNALSRDLFPMDYHCLGDNENRPVRWMALESLLNNDFSSASDVVRTAVHVTVQGDAGNGTSCIQAILRLLVKVSEGREERRTSPALHSFLCQDSRAATSETVRKLNRSLETPVRSSLPPHHIPLMVTMLHGIPLPRLTVNRDLELLSK